MICVNLYDLGGEDICDTTELKAICGGKKENCECGKFEEKEN